jgi:hypothetical protein
MHLTDYCRTYTYINKINYLNLVKENKPWIMMGISDYQTGLRKYL